MIGVWLAGLLLGQAADWSPSGWQEFDRRESLFGRTAFLYNRSSVRRSRSGAPAAWVTWDSHFSGISSSTHVELWEFDCGRRRHRVVRALRLHEVSDRYVDRPSRYRPTPPGSPEAALAERLCG